MGPKSYWLVSIDEKSVFVALLSFKNNNYVISSVGSIKNWSHEVDDSLTQATDESLSEASLSANITEQEEPEMAAFVLPSFWVGSDSKIVSGKLKLIENLCHQLHLKPAGFIANDEAIIEDANKKDGFPASFILIYFAPQEFTLSLVYLGKIKEKVKKRFDGEFDPKEIESVLLQLNSDSTLPPQIIIFGDADDLVVKKIKSHPWVGRKDIETFLHFPDVKTYNTNEILSIYVKVISSQINPTFTQPIKEVPDQQEINSEVQEIDELEEVEIEKDSFLEEVDPSELGFSQSDTKLPIINEEPELSNPLFPEESLQEPLLVQTTTKSLPKFQLPNFPKINFSLAYLQNFKLKKLQKGRMIFAPLAILPLFILIIFYFSSAQITLFVTPYDFTGQINVILDPYADSLNLSSGSNIIPVEKKTFNVNASSTIKTTGRKTIGQKATGEIVIYNKQDKTQNLAKGLVLVDSTDKKFELINPVSVASSSSDLEQGIINLGRTKTVISASDIGPEYNINQDVQLRFKDFAETVLIAKASQPFNGGSRQEISAVSQEDKTSLEQSIVESLKQSIEEKINQEFVNMDGVIKDTIQSKKDRIEYNREVGEEADELSASVEASVSIFLLNPNQKEEIVRKIISQKQDINNIDIDPSQYSLSFQVDKLDLDKAIGVLSIEGQSLPKIDLNKVKKSIIGKRQAKAAEVFKTEVDRFYNYHIKTNFQFLKSINPLPFRSDNININIKTESL